MAGKAMAGMKAAMDDQSVAQRVLDHIANGTTDIGQEVWREPVANYRSQERLAAEIERILRRSPVPFCPSAALPEAGSYVAREAAGTPLVVVRGSDGKVRAFRNACRHRGMQVASGTGCARAFVCRYHGWTYNLEGRLRHIPHEEGFPGFDKPAHPLVAVSASERLGLVFVTQDEPALDDDSLGGLAKLIAPISACSPPPNASSRSTGRSCSKVSSRAITSSRRIPRAFCPTASTI